MHNFYTDKCPPPKDRMVDTLLVRFIGPLLENVMVNHNDVLDGRHNERLANHPIN